MKSQIVIMLGILAVILVAGCTIPIIPEVSMMCETDEDCSLSLCDCNCHVSGQTPEELEGKLCGINCREQYGALGCECSIQPSGEGICIKVLE